MNVKVENLFYLPNPIILGLENACDLMGSFVHMSLITTTN
jgi:hypothetical protein